MISIRPETPADFAAVREGLAACAALGEHVVVVLGQPRYYPRFGFVAAATKGLSCEYPVPDGVFMVAELVPGALRGRTGLVKYHAEFARV
jgi:putative acetyltransferase